MSKYALYYLSDLVLSVLMSHGWERKPTTKLFHQWASHFIHRFHCQRQPCPFRLFPLAIFPIRLCRGANATLIRTCLEERRQAQDDCERVIWCHRVLFIGGISAEYVFKIFEKMNYPFLVSSSIFTEIHREQKKLVPAWEMSKECR